MKIGFIQTSPKFGEKEENFKEIERLVNIEQADLLVLPELFATGYTFTSKQEVESFAEDSEGQTASYLKELSNKTGAIVVGGFVEKGNGNIYNSAMMVYDENIVGIYRKIHLFFKENWWFSKGEYVPKVYTVNDTKIGMMICFDWYFPETARMIALQGADIIAHPSNLVMPYCQNAMVTRCLENRVFAITANRIGKEQRGEDNFTFTGQSQITSYKGEILYRADTQEQCIKVVSIDSTNARDKSINNINDLFKERRTDIYQL